VALDRSRRSSRSSLVARAALRPWPARSLEAMMMAAVILIGIIATNAFV
jgi:hypothetical protein